MKPRARSSMRCRRILAAVLVTPGLVFGLTTVSGGIAQAQPPSGQPAAPGAAGDAQAFPPKVPVAPPKVTPPKPLPKPPPGAVPLNSGLRIVGRNGTATGGASATPSGAVTPETPPSAQASGSAGATPNAAAPSPNAATPNAATPNAAAAPSPTAAVAAAAVANPNKVGLRALVLALDANDYGTPTWKAMLDRVGAAYDVINAKDAPITADTFVRADGGGKYNAILLTDGMLLYQDSTGAFVSALDANEWNTLWAYERDYKVRQVALFASYGTFPEDYCLRAGSEGAVGDTPLNTTLTTAGMTVFDDLNTAVQIPITQSWVYRDTLAAGCSATSVLTAGSSVLGVQSTSTDGRERMALTFSSNQYLLQAHLLTYGLFRWASKGLYFGEQRHYFNTDVDDWFNSTDEMSDTGVLNQDPGFQMTAHDAYNARTQQNALRTKYPLANSNGSAFTFAMAFNAGDANMTAGANCSPNGGINQLTATSRCIRNDVRWINHTLTHPKMNFTDYATSRAEIDQNLARAATLGLPTDGSVLKTGEYSGLGVYHPDPNNDVDPPTDFGLQAANVNLLQAAFDAQVKYLHGNMSFVSHQPKCFNCATAFPKPTDNPPGPNIPENVRAGLLIVPDWPTNIAYFSTTPAEETYFYNWYYGPNGKFPFFPVNQTYAQILENESAQALSHIATGSLYTHTLHIGNLRDYGSGKTLATDWVDATFAKYTQYYKVPLHSPNWPVLAATAQTRNAHFAELTAGVDAVYDRVANTVTATSPAAGKITVSGAQTAGFTSYGTEVSAVLTFTANQSITFTPKVRA